MKKIIVASFMLILSFTTFSYTQVIDNKILLSAYYSSEKFESNISNSELSWVYNMSGFFVRPSYIVNDLLHLFFEIGSMDFNREIKRLNLSQTDKQPEKISFGVGGSYILIQEPTINVGLQFQHRQNVLSNTVYNEKTFQSENVTSLNRVTATIGLTKNYSIVEISGELQASAGKETSDEKQFYLTSDDSLIPKKEYDINPEKYSNKEIIGMVDSSGIQELGLSLGTKFNLTSAFSIMTNLVVKQNQHMDFKMGFSLGF